MPDAPKDVLRRFFATLSTGDFAAIGEFFGDDSVWMVNDVARGFPSERGRRAIIEDFLQPVREGLFEPGDPKIEVVRMIGEGDWAVAETVGRGTLRNGNAYENSHRGSSPRPARATTPRRSATPTPTGTPARGLKPLLSPPHSLVCWRHDDRREDHAERGAERRAGRAGHAGRQ